MEVGILRCSDRVSLKKTKKNKVRTAHSEKDCYHLETSGTSIEHSSLDVSLRGRPALQIWLLVRPQVADCTWITPESE